MVKHKVDGCITTIERKPGYFVITTKLYLDKSDINIIKEAYDVLSSKMHKFLNKERCILNSFVYERDNYGKIYRIDAVTQSIVRMKDYKMKIAVVSRQQSVMKAIKEYIRNKITATDKIAIKESEVKRFRKRLQNL